MLLSKSESNFNTLSEKTVALIEEMILSAARDRKGPEGYINDSDCIKAIEFQSRDGFIANPDNRGGLTYRNFSDLMEYWGGGYTPAHKGAAKEIARQIDLSLEDVKGIEDESERQDAEHEALTGNDSSIMHEIRFMYHGVGTEGLHTASVSAAVNTEGPYHRSSIPWAPEVFCEGAKEVEITWKNQSELKRKLDAALKKVSKAIF